MMQYNDVNANHLGGGVVLFENTFDMDWDWIFNLIITSYLLKDTILEQEKQTKLVNLLQSWIDEEDEQEQQETGEYLIEALNQDRLSERPLFPAELKGVTW